MIERAKKSYFIYTYCPVNDDPNIRGSCEEFKTRKKISKDEIYDKSLEEIDEK